MSVEKTNCPFCKAEAKFWQVKDMSGYYGFDCTICGLFNITYRCTQKIEDLKEKYPLLNCISDNIATNPKTGAPFYSWHLDGDSSKPPHVTVKVLEHFLAIPIDHAEKPKNLLLMMGGKLKKSSPTKPIKLSPKDILQLKIGDADELSSWILTLKSQHHISFQSWSGSWENLENMLSSLEFSVLPGGWNEIADIEEGGGSKRVFIAMQFNWGDDLRELNAKYLEAVREGCRRCGYEANIVSDGHTGPILDKILAEIRTSDFMIVDFTFNNRGAYFEAGYGRALGIPVIHTVMEGHTEDRDDKEKRLHFDIQQINYIKWSDTGELADRIESRIKAVIAIS